MSQRQFRPLANHPQEEWRQYAWYQQIYYWRQMSPQDREIVLNYPEICEMLRAEGVDPGSVTIPDRASWHMLEGGDDTQHPTGAPQPGSFQGTQARQGFQGPAPAGASTSSTVPPGSSAQPQWTVVSNNPRIVRPNDTLSDALHNQRLAVVQGYIGQAAGRKRFLEQSLERGPYDDHVQYWQGLIKNERQAQKEAYDLISTAYYKILRNSALPAPEPFATQVYHMFLATCDDYIAKLRAKRDRLRQRASTHARKAMFAQSPRDTRPELQQVRDTNSQPEQVRNEAEEVGRFAARLEAAKKELIARSDAASAYFKGYLPPEVGSSALEHHMLEEALSAPDNFVAVTASEWTFMERNGFIPAGVQTQVDAFYLRLQSSSQQLPQHRRQ
ncbi:hypothetical protein EXIGLDRAFT_752679 [Exidia glandulosa HHB12029]|uniref:Uncharacterized protein n=1 Tax=Exidia glandulosa HHB12029 TaxID=1314781 RepID=A0A165ZY06_EXIGL|nr:hypothetical protein EXIGLDRAFT_752679 [Exidia glandulosa HHB12029]